LGRGDKDSSCDDKRHPHSLVVMRERASLRDGRSGNHAMSDGSRGYRTNVSSEDGLSPLRNRQSAASDGFRGRSDSVRSAALPILQMIGFSESIV
jgi:hypothetical protein